jgi:F-type H+-transporting ATPase subunit epsilon
MNHFSLILRDTSQHQQFDDLVSFVGEDDSGSFGIQSGHRRMMTRLVFGLARFRTTTASWQYLAMPGAILYFDHNRLLLNTRRYFLSEDMQRMTRVLRDTLTAEEQALAEMKQNLERLEDGVMQRLWELGKERPRLG